MHEQFKTLLGAVPPLTRRQRKCIIENVTLQVVLEHVHRVVYHPQRDLRVPLEQFMVNLSPRNVLLHPGTDEGKVVLEGSAAVFALWKRTVF